MNLQQRSAAIHLVNWNLRIDGERGEIYRNVTLTLLAPSRWERITSAVYHQPSRKSVTLQPELHEDSIRLTVPQIETWGMVEIRTANSTP